MLKKYWYDNIMSQLSQVKKELNSLADSKQAIVLSRFFKTGLGEYGEGDKFLGIKVPIQRAVAKKYDLPLTDIQSLLDSTIHEYRLCALFILIAKYNKAKKQENKKLTKQIIDLYLKNFNNINNWDLVDLSASNIIGDYLLENNRSVLYKFACSNHLWKKRIAILATYAFIRHNDFEDTLNIAKILLHDEHDLIHKAVGWMLREVGKRDQRVEEKFLNQYYRQMPRTMLRYAIEKFSDKKRKFYLKK